MAMTDNPSVRLSAQKTATYLGVSRSTLAKWRMAAKGPPFHRLGERLVYYFKHEIDAWLDDCDQQSAAKASRACQR